MWGLRVFSVRPAESLRLELLEDDRLLTRVGGIRRAFEEVVEYVVGHKRSAPMLLLPKIKRISTRVC